MPSSAVLDVRIGPDDTPEQIVAKAAKVVPSPRQLAWQKLEFTAFVHFGVNTFTGREWGDGKEDPSIFNPTELDARQWIRTFKAAGVRLVILTAKHHDGFCLWPSRYTEHSVKNSPWRGGKGDVVREFTEACRAEGMKIGLYLSPWDRHEPTYGDSPRYDAHFRNQLTELLTQYGTVDEVWFDGANGEGPNGKRQVYDWPSYFALIRRLQPNAVIAISGPDVRWCGNEAGISRESEWSVIPDPLPGGRNHQSSDLGSRNVLFEAAKKGAVLKWHPAEVDTSIRPGWFYHAEEDGRVKALDHLLDIYYGAVGGNAVLLLNVPPDRRGLLHENDVRRLEELGRVVGATFGVNLAAHAKPSIPGAKVLLDDNDESSWTGQTPPNPTALEFDLGRDVEFNVVELKEAIRNGQRIERFHVDVYREGQWQEAAASTTVGYRRLIRLPRQQASKVRVRITESRAAPVLAGFGLYSSPAILRPPTIRRDRSGEVRLEADPGIEVRFTVDGTKPTPSSSLYEKPFALRNGGQVRALAVATGDVLDFGEGAESQMEFGYAKSDWKVVHADSEEPGDGNEAWKAIDEDASTFWHTQWMAANPPHAHEIVVDLGAIVAAGGFTYLPRQDRSTGGLVSRYEVFLSVDGVDWGEPVATGEFANIANNPVLQVVRFDRREARFVRFRSLASPDGKPWASAAELGVLP